MQQKCGELAVG
jgi:hypothetical protein